MKTAPAGRLYQWVNSIEETVIALLLAVMTIVTFANVIARYVFNDNILWALEVTVFLFAWLVLLGASYSVKHNLHIGVDVLVKPLPPGARRVVTLLAVTACLVFSILLLKGSWDYWYPFASTRAFMETNDVPMPDMFQFVSTLFNDGEKYEKMPRFIPYFVLPLSMALLTLRFAQAGWRVLRHEQDLIVAGHEAEEMIEQSHNQPTSATPAREA